MILGDDGNLDIWQVACGMRLDMFGRWWLSYDTWTTKLKPNPRETPQQKRWPVVESHMSHIQSIDWESLLVLDVSATNGPSWCQNSIAFMSPALSMASKRPTRPQHLSTY